ncbi:hypothetical protein [Sphingomonas sp. 28-62-11]|uniref:hypothetical protein n=1 Tax=Sphingomonas sp. 28-62-11 TaxID=1970432 RepID=UPI0035A9523D
MGYGVNQPSWRGIARTAYERNSLDPQDIAAVRIVTDQTLRGQIKRICAKTGSRNEADLMRILSAIRAQEARPVFRAALNANSRLGSLTSTELGVSNRTLTECQPLSTSPWDLSGLAEEAFYGGDWGDNRREGAAP